MAHENALASPRPLVPDVWLLDGYNVLHTVVLRGDREHWWREDQRNRLISLAATLDAGGAPIWVVFDGPHPLADAPDDPEQAAAARARSSGAGRGVGVVFAPDADDWILRRVRSAHEPQTIAVVSADRRLCARVQSRGGRVISPRSFLNACGGATAAPPTGIR